MIISQKRQKSLIPSRRIPHAVACLAPLFVGIAAPTSFAQAPAAPAVSPATPRLTLEPVRTGKDTDLFYFPPGAVSVRLRAENTPVSASVRWTALDFAGQTVAKGTLTPGAAPSVLRIPANKPGIVYVSAVLVGADDKEISAADTRFAILKPRPIPTAPLAAEPLPILFGVCGHIASKSEVEATREVTAMSALGFRGCRFDYNWTNVQPTRDAWNWSTYDRIFGLLEEYRIEPLPIIAYTTRWATTGDPDAKDWHAWHNAPPIVADYTKFAAESVKRYGRTTRYWEIWNEPDIAFWLGTAEQYASLFDGAINAIHTADPKAKVMNGGFSETMRRPEFIPTWMKTAKTKPDIFAYHSHNAFGNMLRASDHVKGYMTPERWTMPVWLNEAGYSSVGKQTERDQAIALVKKMSSAPALGFRGYFVYDIRNDGTSSDENEHNFGLVRQDFTPKASAVAVHTLLGAIEGQRFVRRIPVPGLTQAWALLFERPDAKAGTLVLWNAANASVPLFWQIPAGATRISLMGESAPLVGASGLVSLALTPEPQFVQFSGAAAKVQVAGRLLQFESPITASANDPAPFRVTLQNPLDKPLRGTLKLNPTGGWSAEPAAITVDVPAKGTREYRANVAPSPTSGGIQEMQMDLTAPALPSAVSARVSLLPALLVPKRTEAPTLGDFATRTAPVKSLARINIVSLFEATPMQDLMFHGDDDLSAKIYLSRVPQGLSLAVRVKDNIFAQKEEAGMEWKGDSVQFALSLPTGEHYEGVLALTKNGPVAYLTIAPNGVAVGKLVSFPLSVRRDGNETLYDVIIPAELPGAKPLPDRFRFSLIVNDNDGAGRKGWAEWTPGIGQTKDPALFQSVIVR